LYTLSLHDALPIFLILGLEATVRLAVRDVLADVLHDPLPLADGRDGEHAVAMDLGTTRPHQRVVLRGRGGSRCGAAARRLGGRGGGGGNRRLATRARLLGHRY